jgi:hypothetical protein
MDDRHRIAGNGGAGQNPAYSPTRPLLAGLQAGRFGELIPLLPGFKTWVSGLLLFAVAGVVALVRALVTL